MVVVTYGKYHTPRHIIHDVEYIRDSEKEDAVVDVKLGSLPFRLLRPTSVRTQRFGFHNGVTARINDGLIRDSGRGGEAGIERVGIVDAGKEG